MCKKGRSLKHLYMVGMLSQHRENIEKINATKAKV